MAHAREQIRKKVATELMGLATTGSRVHVSRATPVTTLPCLIISSVNDEVVDNTSTSQTRSLTLSVTGFAKGRDQMDDDLDDISAEVEAALSANTNLDGTVQWCVLTNTSLSYLDGGEQPIGSVQMDYQIIYTIANGVPTVLT